MNLYDKLKPYVKYIQIISMVSGSALLIGYKIHTTSYKINSVVNSNVLARDKKYAPEYLYIDDPMYSIRLKKEEDEQNKHTFKFTRFWKGVKHSVALRLLWLCQHGNDEQRNIALVQLAAFKKNKPWDCMKLAQALDEKTAVLLARTEGTDLRYFLPPPIHVRRAVIAKELLSFKLRDMIISLQKLNPHSCIHLFLSKYFTNLQEPAIEVDSVPPKPDSVSEHDLCMLCLDALNHHLNIFETYDSTQASLSETLVKMELLPLLAELFLRNDSDVEMDHALMQVLTILSVNSNLLRDFFQNGLIGQLARLIRSPDIRLSSSAAVCLANLSGEHSFKPGLYLLHPIYRTSEPRTCDILLVHGLRGGVFVTWRQRDKNLMGIKEEAPSNSTAKMDPYIADPDLKIMMEEMTKLKDDTLLSDFEIVLHDLPVEERRVPANNRYTAIEKQEALVQEDQDRDRDNYTYCWPRDWLPRDCKNLRVLGVDYWTSLSEWLGRCPLQTADIYSRAHNLSPILLDAEVGKDKTPIVWLSHSMGGLIVKQILVESDQNRGSSDKQLSDSTRAVLFFSTPHIGSAVASMPRAAAVILWPSTDVRQLQENSPVLLELQKDFLKLAEAKSWETVSFSENKPTLVTAFKVPIRFVESASADLGRGVFYELPLDHLCICKPETRQSILYTTVVNVIQRAMLIGEKPERPYPNLEWFLNVLFQLLKTKSQNLTPAKDDSPT